MHRGRGYTLIELLVVLALIALLGSIAMPLAEVTVQREKERELKRALWELRDAIDAYHLARQRMGAEGAASYPPNLEALTQPLPDVRPGGGGVLRVLRQVPRDPFADPLLPAEQSWGLRSYLSESKEPRAGAEVYDVYSLSPARGLNGVPLKEW
ncbi:type II secretion system protein [Aquincola sp. MAHUQ-54]|uniref:Type II secretion system protein n=1 Tax=Aquincola agrisoli TaxID=3119538 RepID=A0AAW9Q3X0_9BURK